VSRTPLCEAWPVTRSERMVERASGAIRARHAAVGPTSGFLERFRRTAGVPAAAGGDSAAELAPVFAALDSIEGEAAEIRRRAETTAAQRLQETEEQVQGILADARERADFERDDALKAGGRVADAEVASILEQAERGARQVREAGERRLPALVADVLRRVLEAGS
jgi:vacuolar-type H+-ATPase subunit H